MQRKGVIFDMDGTLLDTLHDIADAVNYAIQALGFKAAPIDKYKSFLGNGIKKTIMRAASYNNTTKEGIALSDQQLKKALELYNTAYAKGEYNKTKPYPGMYKMLDKLSEMNISLAILSNKDHNFVREIAHKFFSDYNFIELSGLRDGIIAKPDPNEAIRIANKMRLNCSELNFVGDNKADIITANTALMNSVGVSWGFSSKETLIDAGAKAIIDTPNDLLALF